MTTGIKWNKTREKGKKLIAAWLAVFLLAGGLCLGPGGGSRAEAAETGFADLPADHWAAAVMARMSAKGVIRGYVDGTIRPDNPVTRLETVVMIVNLLGWEELALTKTEISSELVDGDLIPWGKGHVAVAVEKGIIPDADLLDFRHGDQAKRHEAAVFLVRAAGLDEEAQEQMTAVIDFADALEIPEGSRGYLAVAVEKGFMAGSDGNLLPLEPVSRAQMAALLSRIDDYLDGQGETFAGTVDKVEIGDYEHRLTVTLPSGVKRLLEMTSQAEISLNGKQAGIAQLAAGQQVDVTIKRNQVAKIEGNVNIFTTYTGRVVAVNPEQREITIEEADKSRRVFAIPTSIQLRREGKVADFSEVKIGDQLEVQVHQSGLMLTANVRVVLYKVQGTVWGATAVPERSVVVETAGGLRTYKVAADAVLKKDGQTILLEQLKEGDLVEVQVLEDTVYTLQATSLKQEVDGYFKEIVAVTGNWNQLVVVNDQGQEKTYQLAAGTPLLRGGNLVEAKDIGTGDYVRLQLENNIVTRVDVIQYELEELVGVIKSVNRLLKVMVVTIADGTAAMTREVHITGFTLIYKWNEGVNINSIESGDRVLVTGYREEGVFVATKVVVSSAGK